MRALTLTQPWASLMAEHAKEIETRSWHTKYRGEMVIHAAKGFPRHARDLMAHPDFSAALQGKRAEDLPRSCGLCVVRLIACVPTRSVDAYMRILKRELLPNELRFGDYTAGRYAWITEFVRPLDLPQATGSLGLWDWNTVSEPEL